VTLAVGSPPPGHRAWIGVAPLVALVAVGAGALLGWGGVDVAASVHRIIEFRQYGYSLWDGSWYGGQWTLAYSVAFAPIAATVGLHLLALAAAAVAALSFERIVTPTFGRAGRVGAVTFALGIAVQTTIGQFPYLSGEALALAALWAASRQRWTVAWGLGAAATLLSPLAGAFVALAALTWALAERRAVGRRRTAAALGVAVAALLPLAVTTLLFPGGGTMPFSGTDCAWDLVIAAVLLAATRRRHRALRIGLVLYAAVLVASFAVASPVGGNAGRLEDDTALPIAALLLWPRRRILLAVGLPLLVSSATPAWGAVSGAGDRPSTHAAFYAPLDAWLTRADPDGTRGRVEVVPTADHWESVWVADVEPLARGWERQSDVSQNPIFYTPDALTPRSYRAWLLADGVAYVALPRATLDVAGVAEGRLVASGLAGLRPVWHDADWRVWAVEGSPGLVSGPGRVLTVSDERIVVAATRPGRLLVRVSWDDNWVVTAGPACARSAGRWTSLIARAPGVISLGVSMDPPPADACRPVASSTP
jgi:hypothetical protein